MLAQKETSIGEVFTPLPWGRFACKKADLARKWLDGAIIVDPFMGQGALFFALIDEALALNAALKSLPLHNLFGFDLKQSNIDAWLAQAAQKGIAAPPSNFQQADFFFLETALKADIIFTNPPWISFGDLEPRYKEKIKPVYHECQLISDTRNMLLGGSRIDLAALGLVKSCISLLKPQGEAIAFLPLSLFLSHAHESFRKFSWGRSATLRWIYDLTPSKAFKNVGCRYGLASFVMDKPANTAAPWRQWKNSGWQERRFSFAKPALAIAPLALPKTQAPRQGLNTCGANECFIFTHCTPSDDAVYVANKTLKAKLPAEFVYPLIAPSNILRDSQNIEKWVLLPYSKDGKPLSPQQLKKFPLLHSFLKRRQEALEKRKGTLLKSYMKKGVFYALLGVSHYSFTPYKVVWQAMGAKEFHPRIFEGCWQANQAMHAYIPADSHENALTILNYLKQEAVAKFLHSKGQQGSMSFAQPGRIKELLELM